MPENYNKKQVEEGINIRLVPSTPYILQGIENRLFVLLEISADEIEVKSDRVPYNLAMVLDRSGSMRGEKIEFAKKAAGLILDNIQSQDLLHLVIYDDIIEQVFTNGTRDERDKLMQKIKKITARNSTNLAGGLLEGQKILSEYTNLNHSKRVFLFSDGLANVGVTREDQIFDLTRQMHDQGINTTSFGIGKDFNEMMMTGLAEHGRGDYFFIENADAIPHIVEEAIQGLLQTVASNMVLRVRGLNGATVGKLYLHDVMKGAILGDIRGGDTRRVVAELTVDPSKISEGQLLSVEIEYRLADDLTKVRKFTDTLSIGVTSDETLLVENQEVMTYKVQAEVSENELKVYDYLEKMEFDQADTLNNDILVKLRGTPFRDKEGMIDDKLEQLQDMVKYIERAKQMNDSRAAMKRSSYHSYLSKSSRSRDYKEQFRDEK